MTHIKLFVIKSLHWFFCKINQPILSPSRNGACVWCGKFHDCDHEWEQVDVGFSGYGDKRDGTHKRPRCKKCGMIYL